MAKKNSDYGEDFRFLVRMRSTDLDGKKTVATGLTGLSGVNNRLSRVIATHAGIDRRKLLGNLSDEEIQTLTNSVDTVEDYIPTWMYNRRNDPESGEDMHIIGSEVKAVAGDDINRMKKIRCWKGMRHERRLPVRGQRTKANGRRGATVGVQRKK